jgi:hypothetical protein
MFIPDPDLDFLPIPDPGVKKPPDRGSATLVAIWFSLIQNEKGNKIFPLLYSKLCRKDNGLISGSL